VATGVSDGNVFSKGRAQEYIVVRVVEIPDEEFVAPVRILEDIHRLQSFERIFAVEDARVVRTLTLHEQRAPTEASIDGGSANENRNPHSALVELLHAKRHLLRRRYEQRAQSDRVGADLDGLVENGVHGNLLAQIENRVAV